MVTFHGVAKRSLEWPAVGAKRNPCHWLFEQVSQFYAPASKCVADIAKLAPGYHSLVISPSLKVKTINLLWRLYPSYEVNGKLFWLLAHYTRPVFRPNSRHPDIKHGLAPDQSKLKKTSMRPHNGCDSCICNMRLLFQKPSPPIALQE